MRTITFATTDAPRGSGLVTALTSDEHQRGDSVLIATVQEIMPSVGLIQLNYLGISYTILRLVDAPKLVSSKDAGCRLPWDRGCGTTKDRVSG